MGKGLPVYLLQRAEFSHHLLNMGEIDHCIHVGNLTSETDEKTLRDIFSAYGEIKMTKVVRDQKTGISRGFGFVSFADWQQPVNALEMHGKNLNGRIITVHHSYYISDDSGDGGDFGNDCSDSGGAGGEDGGAGGDASDASGSA